MANDGIMLGAIAQQLERELAGSRIEKIVQPNASDVYFSLRCGPVSRTLLLSASPEYPRICLTDAMPKTSDQPTMFCSILRKRLLSGRLRRVFQEKNERVIIIIIEAADELGDKYLYRLIVEIMGRYSNLILTDEKDRILDSAKRVGATVSRLRQVLPGLTYVSPPPQKEKQDPYICQEEEFALPEGKDPVKWLSAHLTGVCATSAAAAVAFDGGVHAYFEAMRRHEFAPGVIVGEDDSFIDSVGLANPSMHGFKPCDASSAVRTWYEAKKKSLPETSFREDRVRRALAEAEKKCAQKREMLEDAERILAEAEKNKLYAELIQANSFAIAPEMTSVEVINYYSGESTLIPLEAGLSPQENAQRYYKRYTKNKNKFESARLLKKTADDEAECLADLRNELEKMLAEGKDVLQVEEKLLSLGYLKQVDQHREKSKRSSGPFHYRSRDGYDIFVGRNAAQNDKLTASASPRDRWFHVKDAAGSHVILRNRKGEFSDEAVMCAALLAAYHSSQKNGVKVAVDYTEARYVDRIRGAKSGAVTYINQKTLYVTPGYEMIAGIRRID